MKLDLGSVHPLPPRRAAAGMLRRAAAGMSRRAWCVLSPAVLALTIVAATATAQPITVQDDRGHSVTLPAAPQRIVSLLPSLTETVCALQACDRLVGVDRHSNWPAQVQRLPRLGGLEDTQIEHLVALKPDLVLLPPSSRAVDRLSALGLPVLVLEPQDWVATQRTVQRVARALGVAERGDALIAATEARISAAATRVPAALRGHSVYFEVASTPYAAGEASFIGALLRRLGLANIVPTALGPFPQLNPEFVLRAQPGLVMASAAALARMQQRPGWSTLQALQTGQRCGFAAAEWDTLVRPGPRLADGAEAIVQCLLGLTAGPPSPPTSAPRAAVKVPLS